MTHPSAGERRECAFEPDVLDAVATGRWPEPGPQQRRSNDELRAHLEVCGSCDDLARIAGLLSAEGELARAEAPLPSPTLVWWRAQVRARDEAARTAARPIRLVQGLALSCVAGLGGTILGASSTHVQDVVAWLAALSPVDLVPASVPIAASVLQRGVVIGLITWVVLAPVAVYLAFAAEE